MHFTALKVERLDPKPLIGERANAFSDTGVLKRLGVKPLHLGKQVGPALVAEPSRDERDIRDGVPTSGSPTGN